VTDEELIKALREPWFTNGCERYQLDAADRIEALVEALERIESITVHSGGEIHGVTDTQWRLAFEQAQDEARAALTNTR